MGPQYHGRTLCTASLLASITPGLQLQPPLRHHQGHSGHIVESPGTGQKYLFWPVRCHSHIKHGDRSVISYFHQILLVSCVLFFLNFCHVETVIKCTGCSKSKVPKVRHCCTYGYAFIWSFIGANYSQTWSILCRSTSVWNFSLQDPNSTSPL